MLLIAMVTRDDAGIYFCIASNSYGNISSNYLTLRVSGESLSLSHSTHSTCTCTHTHTHMHTHMRMQIMHTQISLPHLSPSPSLPPSLSLPPSPWCSCTSSSSWSHSQLPHLILSHCPVGPHHLCLPPCPCERSHPLLMNIHDLLFWPRHTMWSTD